MGTNNSTGGSKHAHRGNLRALLVLAAAALGFLGWVEWRIWKHQNLLGRELSNTVPDRFLRMLQVREQIRQLDQLLLQFEVGGEPADRERFHQTARELSNDINTNARDTSAGTKDATNPLREALAVYLNGAAPLLERSLRGVRRESIVELQREIDELSSPLRALADKLLDTQEAAWEESSERSLAALRMLRGLNVVAVAISIALALLAVAIFHQWSVAPLQDRLRQNRQVEQRQEKLASLGVLAAGVAHELRNPLTAIKFRLFSLRQTLPPSLAENEDLSVVEGEVRRLERIAGEFLQFARPGEPRLGEVTSSEFVNETAGLVRGELDRRGLKFRVEPGEPAIFRADRQQLQQVMINLVHNAAESTPRGGSITLRARTGAATLSGRSQSAVWVEVSDTGSGIPPEAERRLFDPFFSTKPGGTGLGLSIAARIVEVHGGTIQYVTAPGEGTTFSVLLPRTNKHESQDSADRG